MNSAKDYIRTALETIQYSFGELMVSNIFWVLLMIPIITIPPAFAGLNFSVSQLVINEPVNRQTFFKGFKKYFQTSYVWFFTNVIVVGILLFNIDLSIQNSQVLWLQYLRGIYWVLLGVWMLLQIYSFPLLIQQEKPRLALALRNSAMLWFKHTLFSLLLSVVIIILVVASSYLFPLWFVITASLIAYLTNLGVVYLLSKE
jgi:uncharacterized membrane protein YesL